MLLGSDLIIKGPSYFVIQSNGRPFVLGKLLKRTPLIPSAKERDQFEFECMPSLEEFPIGINNCRYVNVFLIVPNEESEDCCCGLFDINEYSWGPVYEQR
jgi:hypothetical protein